MSQREYMVYIQFGFCKANNGEALELLGSSDYQLVEIIICRMNDRITILEIA